MNTKKRTDTVTIILRILLPLACVLWCGFIFANSSRPAEQSSAQSSVVVDAVQKVAQVIAPESKIATATGSDYKILHAFIRKAAHFCEYAVLGALFCWCYFVYTNRWNFVWLPLLGIILVPTCDELFQLSVAGRAGTFVDILIDVSGGAVGFAFALFILWLGACIHKKSKSKRKVTPGYAATQEKEETWNEKKA